MAERKTVGELDVALSGHVELCEKLGRANEARLKRIESILIGVAGAIILQLIGLCATLFMAAYPPGASRAAAAEIRADASEARAAASNQAPAVTVNAQAAHP